MPGSIDLKFWMAVCWKMSWKLDPLPLSVPLRPLPDEPPLVVLELQAESDKVIAARAAPAITTPWLRTRCMLNIPSQLPAECCEEDGIDREQAFSGVAGADAIDRLEDLSGRLKAGNRAPPHHFPAGHGLGIVRYRYLYMSLTWAFSPQTAIAHDPRSRVAEGHHCYRIGNCRCPALGRPRAI